MNQNFQGGRNSVNVNANSASVNMRKTTIFAGILVATLLTIFRMQFEKKGFK